MTAYVVLFRESKIHDPAEMEAYARVSQGNPRDPNLVPLVVYGEQEAIEGNPPDGVVVLQFPTMDDARNWYYGENYQKAAVHRLRAADYRGVIVQGF